MDELFLMTKLLNTDDTDDMLSILDEMKELSGGKDE